MGYDITFHPIKREEITHFLFNVIEDPSLAPQRINELSQDEHKRDFLQECYNEILEVFSNKHSQHIESSIIAYHCATISSFLHPYWYVHNQYLSRFIQDNILKDDIFTSLLAKESGKNLKRVRDKSLLITENYTASGFVENKTARNISQHVLSQFKQVQKQLLQDKEQFIKSHTSILDKFKKLMKLPVKSLEFDGDDTIHDLDYLINEDDEFFWALHSLEEYCAKHDTGFIEASDVIVPMMDEFRSDPENLNARFLNE